MCKIKSHNFMGLLFLSFIIFIGSVYGQESSDQYYQKIKKSMYLQNQENLRGLQQSTANVKLKILSYNLGLLSNIFYGVPKYHERSKYLREGLSDFIEQESPDILCLQEIWYEIDFNTVSDVALTYDYLMVDTDFHGSAYHHGLQIMVKKSILGNEEVILSKNFKGYKNKDGKYIRSFFERFSKTVRGILFTYINLPALKTKVLVSNTHLTPFLTYNKLRIQQIESMIKLLVSIRKKADYFVVAGDFNIATDFQIRTNDDRKKWEKGRTAYYYLFKHTGLMDFYLEKAVNISGFTYDLENPITHREGPTRRLDYIFGGSSIGKLKMQNGLYIKESRVVFKENMVTSESKECVHKKDGKCLKFIEESQKVPLSDHYGVLSDILFYK